MSKMKDIRQERVKEEKKKSIVCNNNPTDTTLVALAVLDLDGLD
jgi:hypothetical protein